MTASCVHSATNPALTDASSVGSVKDGSTEMSQGVCRHSTVAAQTEWVIFSSSHCGCKTVLSVLAALKRITGFKELVGSWKGVEEAAYLVTKHDFEELQKRSPSLLKGQEAVLELSPVNARGIPKARFVWLATNETQDVGHFLTAGNKRPVTGDYTYDPSTNTYYVIGKHKSASSKRLSKLSKKQRAFGALRQSTDVG